MSSETDLTHLEKNLFLTFNADANDGRFQALMKLFAVVRAAKQMHYNFEADHNCDCCDNNRELMIELETALTDCCLDT